MYALYHQLSIAHTLIAIFLAVNNPFFLFSGFPMVDWFERLFKCFIEFRECHNWRCRYIDHRGEHWQDETLTIYDEHPVSIWKLHGRVIAQLHRPAYGNVYMLVLRDAGYPTPTTISRLNGILYYLKKMGIEHNVEFRLKYTKERGAFRFYPVHSYVVVSGRKFRVDTVKMLIDFAEKKLLSIFVDESREVRYVAEDKGLEKIRRACRQINRLVYDVRDVINSIYQRDWQKAREYEIRLEEIGKKIDDATSAIVEEDGVMYGVYVKRLEDALKLIDLAKELRKLYREARQALAYTMMTQ